MYACMTWQGGEFDPVKPLMEARVCYKNHIMSTSGLEAAAITQDQGLRRSSASSLSCATSKTMMAQLIIVQTCTIIGNFSFP
jgi:hypothetical protein